MADSRSTVAPSKTWSPWACRIVGILVTLHLTAIIVAPLAGPPPASQLFQRLSLVFDPYLKATFLGHGYRFFAPNPGPSHLVRYEITLPDGRRESHQFPDTQAQWPRLLYHRHFMVAEQLNQLVSIPSLEEFATQVKEREAVIEDVRSQGQDELAARLTEELERDRAAYDQQRSLADQLLAGMGDYLLRHHDATAIEIFSVRHPLLGPDEILAGAQLNAPETYLERPVYRHEIDSALAEELP